MGHALEETNGGCRVVLFDRLIGAGDDDDEAPPHARTAPLHFCRHCGAAHPGDVSRCLVLRHGRHHRPVVRGSAERHESQPGER